MKNLSAVTQALTSVEMFENWMVSVSGVNAESNYILGSDLNCLMNSTHSNWWPYTPRDFGAHYHAQNLFRVSKKGIYIIRETIH